MSDTAVLPRPVLPAAGTYTLRRDRCVVEVSLPLLHGRLTATGGRLAIGDSPEFTVTLDPASLRTGVPFLSRAVGGAEWTFTAEEPDIDDTFVLVGRVGGWPGEIRLHGDLRYVEEDRIVVYAKGIASPPRRPPRGLGRVARLLARRRVRVEIAMEFVR